MRCLVQASELLIARHKKKIVGDFLVNWLRFLIKHSRFDFWFGSIYVS